MDGLPTKDMGTAQQYWGKVRECEVLELTEMGLILEVSIPRAVSSAGRGGDLPSSGPGRDGELSILHILLKCPPESCMKKGRTCPVT